MNRSVRRLALVSVTIAALSAATLPADAGGRRTRPRGSSAQPAAGQSTAVSRQVTRGTAPTRVSGKATYGYYGRGSAYPSYWYPSYGYPGSYWWYWGWPYFGYWAYWGWPYYSHAPYAAAAGERHRGAPALLETDVRPKKAELLLDGEPVGQARDYNGTWDLLTVKPGMHMLEFRYPGYMTLRLHVDARGGARYRIVERLRKGEGIDPRSMEEPPQRPADEAEAIAPREATPQPPPERGSLTRGLLHVRASPPDAAVYLDGEFLARADELARLHGALPVAVGRHVIEVVRPGFEARSMEIEVSGEEPRRVTIDLARLP